MGQGISSPWCLAGWGKLKEAKRLVTCSPCVQEVRDRSQLDPVSVPCRRGDPRAVSSPGRHFSQGNAKGWVSVPVCDFGVTQPRAHIPETPSPANAAGGVLGSSWMGLFGSDAAGPHHPGVVCAFPRVPSAHH